MITTEHPRRIGIDQADQALQVLQAHLGGALAAAYLYGSAVDGGLRPASDLDLLIATREPLRGESRARLFHELLSRSYPPNDSRGRPLEVTVVVVDDVIPWRYPPTCELQFGEWLRSSLEGGHTPAPRPDPDLAILLTVARSCGIAIVGPAADRFFEPVPAADVRGAISELWPELVANAQQDGDERNALLTIARMWVTLTSGEILPKDIAAERMIERLPEEHREVLGLARAAYLGQARDDWSKHSREVEAFLRYASAVLTKLTE